MLSLFSPIATEMSCGKCIKCFLSIRMCMCYTRKIYTYTSVFHENQFQLMVMWNWRSGLSKDILKKEKVPTGDMNGSFCLSAFLFIKYTAQIEHTHTNTFARALALYNSLLCSYFTLPSAIYKYTSSTFREIYYYSSTTEIAYVLLSEVSANITFSKSVACNTRSECFIQLLLS